MSDRTPCPCGDPCSFAEEDGLCWGIVDVASEENDENDHWWIHECEAHEGYADGVRVYKPKPIEVVNK